MNRNILMDKTANDEYDELLNIMETSFKMNNNPDILNIDSSKVKILDYNTENDTNGPDVIISKLDNTYKFTLFDPYYSIHSTLSVRFKCMHFRTLLFHIFIIPYDSFLDDSKHFNIILNFKTDISGTIQFTNQSDSYNIHDLNNEFYSINNENRNIMYRGNFKIISFINIQ